MTNKFSLIFALIIISLVVPIAIINGQVSNSDLIAISNNELTFHGNATETELTKQIFIVGVAQNVQVNFFTGQLYDNNSQNKILIKDIPSFSLSTHEQKQIDITIETSGAKPATYYGSIIVLATNSESNTTKAINITVVIKEQTQSLLEQAFSYASQFIVLIVVLALLGIAILLSRRNKLAWAIIFTFIALSLWFSSIIVSVFKPDLVTAISTAIIVPIAAFIIDRVKKESDDKTAQIKTSTEILTDSIKDDVNWAREVMGEIVTHFSSFRPEFEGMNSISRSPEIIYPERGTLDRQVWDKNCKQGSVSDLPTLHFQKYYSYVELYNRYYKAAVMLTKGKNVQAFTQLEKDSFFINFEVFRSKYAELETVLFVYMSYLIGLFGKTRLSALRIEYPRVTRVLLYRLMKYDIIDIDKYVTEKELTDALGNIKEKDKFKKENFEEENYEEIDNEKYKLALASKFYNYKTLENIFQKWYDDKLRAWGAALDLEFSQAKGKYKLKKWLFKNKIKNWSLSPSDFDKLLKDIYYKDDIPVFHREAGKDFRKRYGELLESIKNLDPLPLEFVKKEKIPDILKQLDVHKGLLDELEKLDKLNKQGIIVDPEYTSVRQQILAKLKD